MKITCYFVATCLLLSCCSVKTKDIQKIEVEHSETYIVELSDKMALKNPHAVLTEPLGLIWEMYYKDNTFIINSDKKVYRFDQTGSFLGNISAQGRGPNEYIGVHDMWVKGDELFMWDINGKQVIKYNLKNQALSTVPVSDNPASNPFQYLIPLKNGGYIGRMMFQGSVEVPPELAFYNDDFVFMTRIGDLQLNSGLNFGRPLSQYKDETLYWRGLENTIYSIDNEGNIAPKYEVDFLGHNLPAPKKGEDDYVQIERLVDTKGGYATFLANVMESDDYLLFTYMYEEYNYLVRYNKRNKKTETLGFQTSAADIKAKIFVTSPDDIFVYVPEDDFSTIYHIDLPAIIKNAKS